MSTPTSTRVQKHREALRRAGLRPVQIWVPDTRQVNFARTCDAQCRRVAKSDHEDVDMHTFMDTNPQDTDGWTA
ncbi:MAG TPA: antitoxin MazE family protein [Rhodanobacteraceae bacterium]